MVGRHQTVCPTQAPHNQKEVRAEQEGQVLVLSVVMRETGRLIAHLTRQRPVLVIEPLPKVEQSATIFFRCIGMSGVGNEWL